MLIRWHRTKRARIRHANQMQRHIRIALFMRAQDRPQIRTREHITVKHHHRVRTQLRQHIANRPAGTQRLFFNHVLNIQTEIRAVPEVLLKHLSAIRGAQHHMPHTCGSNARQQMLQERIARSLQHRLRRGHRQRPQPCPLPTDQDDGICINCTTHCDFPPNVSQPHAPSTLPTAGHAAAPATTWRDDHAGTCRPTHGAPAP